MPNYKSNLTYKANFKIFDNANSLKRTMTEAEIILWNELQNRRLNNAKFRRQHPIDKFIVDFYCHEKKLVIELDGGIHEVPDVKERDENRSVELENLGVKIIRFKNEEIIQNLEIVLQKIKSEII